MLETTRNIQQNLKESDRMKKKIEDLRSSRLEIAVAICNSTDGDTAAKQKILKDLCDADPVIGEVLRFFRIQKGVC